jgi:hypothetical protein
MKKESRSKIVIKEKPALAEGDIIQTENSPREMKIKKIHGPLYKGEIIATCQWKHKDVKMKEFFDLKDLIVVKNGARK